MRVPWEDITWLDWETYSDVDDLRVTGAYRYAEHASIRLCGYALGGEEPRVWDLDNEGYYEVPDDLAYSLIHRRFIAAHNGMLFDRLMAVKHRTIAPLVKGKIWYDTMVVAYMHSLPGALKTLSHVVYGLPEDISKMQEGSALVRLFCKPQLDMFDMPYKAGIDTHPAEWATYVKYCGNDIIAMREVDRRMPHWNYTPGEIETQIFDMHINDAGFLVDVEFAEGAIRQLEIDKKIRDKRTQKLTEDAEGNPQVNAASQRDALLRFILSEYGIDLPDMKKSTLERRIEDTDLPAEVKELLYLRLESASTASSKYKVALKIRCDDNRVRGTLIFRGAWRTGRWAARLFQPQNLPRPAREHTPGVIEDAIQAVKYDSLDLFYESSVPVLTSAIRGLIIAGPGNKLVISDLSSIEGRKLAWLANEKWKLDAYREYDRGVGFDMYVLTYAMSFAVDPADVGDYERKLGKVLELALGYGGGVGAFITFSLVYGIDLDTLPVLMQGRIPKEHWESSTWWWNKSLEQRRTYGLSAETFITCDALKRMWREANPATVAFWDNLEKAARTVIEDPSKVIRVGKLKFDMKGSWMRMRLPSGRYLSYPSVKIINGDITYLGMNSYTRKWCRLKTYGGKLAENPTQASSADQFAYGARLAYRAGYRSILLVHDEAVTEVPDSDEYNVEELNRLLTTNADWSVGLPLAAKGHEAYRYGKDD